MSQCQSAGEVRPDSPLIRLPDRAHHVQFARADGLIMEDLGKECCEVFSGTNDDFIEPMSFTRTAEQFSSLRLNDCGRELEFNAIGFLQPLWQRADGSSRVYTAFRLAPQTSEQSVWIGSRALEQRFFSAKEPQILASFAIAVKVRILFEQGPFIGVMSEV
jgi:hypothetical protein